MALAIRGRLASAPPPARRLIPPKILRCLKHNRCGGNHSVFESGESSVGRSRFVDSNFKCYIAVTARKDRLLRCRYSTEDKF
jgi:hypothetical protein